MYKVGILMDRIESVNFNTDSTISIIKSLQNKTEVKLIFPETIHKVLNNIYATVCSIKIISREKNEYSITKKYKINLNEFDCIFFRKDPPVNQEYITILQLLKELECQNTLVLNSPTSLLHYNEKILGYILSKPKIPSVIGNDFKEIKKLLEKYNEIVLKPINLMAGNGIIKIKNKKGSDVLIKDYLKKYKFVVAQKYLKIIKNGDNRIIIYNGIIEKKILTRYPPKNDFRANISFGGYYEINEIKKKYIPLIEEIAAFLKYHGIFFAGVDMIGQYITEINITSPTGIQQIGNGLSMKIANQLLKNINTYHSGCK